MNDRDYLIDWIKKATDQQVMELCREIVRIAPDLVDCFRKLAIVLVVGGKKEQCVLGLLQEFGELFGLELIMKSDGLLKRGRIYILLDQMESDGLITSRMVDCDGIMRRKYRRSEK